MSPNVELVTGSFLYIGAAVVYRMSCLQSCTVMMMASIWNPAANFERFAGETSTSILVYKDAVSRESETTLDLSKLLSCTNMLEIEK